MASPYLLSNADLQFTQASGQDFRVYLAFLNPIAIATNWLDTTLDQYGNPLPPPNYDTLAHKFAPYQPVSNLGPNRIGFVNEPLYFDGSRSYQRFDLPVVSYAWNYSGGTGKLYANGSQIALTFSSPGLYNVTLTTRDRYGGVTVGARQVMIYQDRDSALPGMIQLSGPQGSLSNGGWQAQINTVNSQFSLYNPDLPVGSYQPIVIMAETRYEIQPGQWIDATIGPNGHFNPGSPYEDPRIIFDGYIQQGSVHQDVDKDTLSFTCVGVQQLMNDAKTHLLGYYNGTYTPLVHGVPTSINPSRVGQGFLVNGLMTNDVIQSILLYHSNIANYHDLHMYNSVIPTRAYNVSSTNAFYWQVYTTLSVTEGTIWDNLLNLTQNEFSTVYCEHEGSIRIGPQINYRGEEYWAWPQLLGSTAASILINLVTELGYTIPADLQAIPDALPYALPALPMPVEFVHPWGPRTQVVPYLTDFDNILEPTVQAVQASLTGPPILCTFSDVPVYDPALSAPQHPTIFAWTAANWPQDLAIYPLSIDVQENYTGKVSLVKLIGTLAMHNSTMSAWYPQNAFQIIGTAGASNNIQRTILPAGNWLLDESHVLPDMTTNSNKLLVTNYWWEMARRAFFANNVNYNATMVLGMCTYIQLGDIVSLTRQNTTLGPRFVNKFFYVDGISYQIDLTSRQWQTQLTLTEVTSGVLTPIRPPPSAALRG